MVSTTIISFFLARFRQKPPFTRLTPRVSVSMASDRSRTLKGSTIKSKARENADTRAVAPSRQRKITTAASDPKSETSNDDELEPPPIIRGVVDINDCGYILSASAWLEKSPVRYQTVVLKWGQSLWQEGWRPARCIRVHQETAPTPKRLRTGTS